ncbi:MAG TPA: DNA polymerase III subunit gamma/tau [Acidimicrobiia bacterium]|jgi:DNA polymerase-3 subunit gamma/tau
MAYQSLYRKYRPQRFAAVVGQHHVTTAVRNAVRDQRVGHAYLFSGPRGTGKTTTARLLAKALNCTNRGPDGDACGVCDNCVGIADGRFLDLFELDAASNNGVDAMRDLTESVHLGLGPTSTYKVYLIDEVHMLSAGASNALLKTLEEPPGHVVFVLATTSPEKVLPTIRSRTQHFDFTLYSLDEISDHLAWVAAQEGVAAEPEALEILARAAAGSMRDALSLLDQAIAHGALDVEQVGALFGGTDFEMRMRILDAVADEDTAGALVAVGELLDGGYDPRRIAEDLLTTSRDVFLLTAGSGSVRVDAPETDVAALGTLGERTGPALLVRTLETLGQAIVDMRGTDAADPRLVLEIALVRLARRDAGPPLQALAERVDRLEKAIEGGAVAAPPRAPRTASPTEPANEARGTGPRKTIGARKRERAAAPDAEPPPDPDPVPEPAPAEPPEAGAAAPSVELDDVVLAWGDILGTLPPATKAAAQEAQPIKLDGDVITFGVARSHFGNAEPRFKKEADNIRDALSSRLGRRMRFKLVAHEGFDADPASRTGAPPPPDDYDDDIVDIAELEATDSAGAAVDSVSRVSMTLGGATVVEEIPHD